VEAHHVMKANGDCNTRWRPATYWQCYYSGITFFMWFIMDKYVLKGISC
jgi:hypothetical protein